MAEDRFAYKPCHWCEKPTRRAKKKFYNGNHEVVFVAFCRKCQRALDYDREGFLSSPRRTLSCPVSLT